MCKNHLTNKYNSKANCEPDLKLGILPENVHNFNTDIFYHIDSF